MKLNPNQDPLHDDLFSNVIRTKRVFSMTSTRWKNLMNRIAISCAAVLLAVVAWFLGTPALLRWLTAGAEGINDA